MYSLACLTPSVGLFCGFRPSGFDRLRYEILNAFAFLRYRPSPPLRGSFWAGFTSLQVFALNPPNLDMLSFASLNRPSDLLGARLVPRLRSRRLRSFLALLVFRCAALSGGPCMRPSASLA